MEDSDQTGRIHKLICVFPGCTYQKVHFLICSRGRLVNYFCLTLSTLYTKTDSFANSVDPVEMAHNEHSHLDPYCLPFWS